MAGRFVSREKLRLVSFKNKAKTVLKHKNMSFVIPQEVKDTLREALAHGGRLSSSCFYDFFIKPTEVSCNEMSEIVVYANDEEELRKIIVPNHVLEKNFEPRVTYVYKIRHHRVQVSLFPRCVLTNFDCFYLPSRH